VVSATPEAHGLCAPPISLLSDLGRHHLHRSPNQWSVTSTTLLLTSLVSSLTVPDTRNKSTCSPQDPAFHQQYPRSRRSSYARTLLPPQNDLPHLLVVMQPRCAAVATPYDVIQMEHLSPYHVVWMGGPSPTSATTTATTQKRSFLHEKRVVPLTDATESAGVIWRPTRQTHGGHGRSDRGGQHLRHASNKGYTRKLWLLASVETPERELIKHRAQWINRGYSVSSVPRLLQPAPLHRTAWTTRPTSRSPLPAYYDPRNPEPRRVTSKWATAPVGGEASLIERGILAFATSGSATCVRKICTVRHAETPTEGIANSDTFCGGPATQRSD